MIGSSSDVLDPWDSRFVRFRNNTPCHYSDVVEVLLLFVEVVQFLVQWLIEQLEILQTSLNIAVFPEPILSTAVVQRILDFVVAQRLRV